MNARQVVNDVSKSCPHPHDSVVDVRVYDDENLSVTVMWCSECGAIKYREIDMDADRLPSFGEWESPRRRRARPAPEDEAQVRADFEDAEKNPERVLTPEEIRRLAETGEWPEWSTEDESAPEDEAAVELVDQKSRP